jgi:hypothetical protein
VRIFTVPAPSEIRAATGSGAIPNAPSANPRQRIDVQVPFDPASARLQVRVVNDWNVESTEVLKAILWDDANSTASFDVPYNAVTGDAVLYSLEDGVRTDVDNGTFLLQIVPVVSGIELYWISDDGTSATVILRGAGLVDDANTEYRFGTGEESIVIRDSGYGTGPQVSRYYDQSTGEYISQAQLTVPLSDWASGPISIKTAGGVSAAFGASLAAVQSVAWSGTPADPTKASANPGQAITLEGSGLSTDSDILLRYTDHEGKLAVVHLSPLAASTDGTRATLLVPYAANGAWALQMFGSASQPVLQVVPTLTGFSGYSLSGSGLVEGATRYDFPGAATVVDDNVGAGFDVTSPYYYDDDQLPSDDSSRDRAYLDTTALRAHGTGGLTVSTAGGTSAPLALNALRPGSDSATTGALADVAVDPASGALWTLDQANPGNLLRLDPATQATCCASILPQGACCRPSP